MLNANQTIKEAWSKFKTYPRFRQIILFNFIAVLPSVFLSLLIGIPDGTQPSLAQTGAEFLVSMISYIVNFLTCMSITHYVCNGWVFNDFREFLKPPSSKWKLFWKAFVIYVVSILLFVVVIGGLGALAATLSATAKFILTFTSGILAIVGCVFFITKFTMIYPFFTMNDDAPLLSVFGFSDGYFKYLLKVMGWVSLYSIPVVIVIFIGLMVMVYVTMLLGTVGIALMTFASFILQIIFTMVIVFIYAEAYNQIVGDKYR